MKENVSEVKKELTKLLETKFGDTYIIPLHSIKILLDDHDRIQKELYSISKQIQKERRTIIQKDITADSMLGNILGKDITIERKDKSIELMAKYIDKISTNSRCKSRCIHYCCCDNNCIKNTIEYFENKAKESE